jgi:curli production assembly/transport component CsgG
MVSRFKTAILLLCSGVLALAGCAPYFHQPFTTERARLGAEVRGGQELRALPQPRERVVVAVYKFRDQTGQYKPTLNGSSFSTAVTQGATSILLRALEESQWFEPIERENLSNLLNERKIIRSTRAEYSEQTGQRQPPLPPLLFAGIILEGGIISYDANMLTGGAGLRYFGAGASGQYRQDRVTVYLRAISTSNGRILKTVYTSKTILSQQVDASLFRFVNFKRLLETETGFTYNEPSELAVKEAIEKSVQALIYEGMQEGLWTPANAADMKGAAMQAYQQEKQSNQQIDVLGRTVIDRPNAWSVGISGAVQQYSGDYGHSLLRPGAELSLRYQWGQGRWNTFVNIGGGQLAARRFFQGTIGYAETGLQLRILPHDKWTPYLLAGVGVTTRSTSGISGFSGSLPHVVAGGGLEYQLTPRFALSLGVDNHLFLSDKLDERTIGNYNDFYWSGRGGVIVYLGR